MPFERTPTTTRTAPAAPRCPAPADRSLDAAPPRRFVPDWHGRVKVDLDPEATYYAVEGL